MSERFTEILRAASEPAWSDAVRHRFVNELFAGAVPDAVMARYLIQDHHFLDSFLTLLGATLASADTFEARVRFGRFIGVVSGEENTFFLGAFEALGVTEDRRTADPDTQPTAGFKAIMREAAETRSSSEALITAIASSPTAKRDGREIAAMSARSILLALATVLTTVGIAPLRAAEPPASASIIVAGPSHSPMSSQHRRTGSPANGFRCGGMPGFSISAVYGLSRKSPGGERRVLARRADRRSLDRPRHEEQRGRPPRT